MVFNWTGTEKERNDFEKNVKERWDKVEGVKVKDAYTPSTSLNRVIIYVVESDKWISNAGISEELRKKIPVSKVEMFFG